MKEQEYNIFVLFTISIKVIFGGFPYDGHILTVMFIVRACLVICQMV